MWLTSQQMTRNERPLTIVNGDMVDTALECFAQKAHDHGTIAIRLLEVVQVLGTVFCKWERDSHVEKDS